MTQELGAEARGGAMTQETRETLEDLYYSHAILSDAESHRIAAALRDVLTPRTCGTCRHIRDGEPRDGWVWCHEKSEHWRVKDGCLLGWQAREGESGGK